MKVFLEDIYGVSTEDGSEYLSTVGSFSTKIAWNTLKQHIEVLKYKKLNWMAVFFG